jgi:hypothetical protein
MFGFNHLPNKIQQNVYTFYANANSGSAGPSGSFMAWNIPETAAVLHFLVIGGGAGGGSGHFSAAGGGSTSGGAGGAAGGLVAVTIPTVLLPRTLYLQVGLGGDGGAPVGTAFGNTAPTNGNPGRNGTRSLVCAFPEINNGSILIASSTTEPAGGGGGIIGASATGTAITVTNFQNERWRGLNGNVITPTAGGGCTAGGSGTGVTYAMLPTGGAGGGGYPNVNGANRTGGSISFANISAYLTAAVNGGGLTVNGSNGFYRQQPFMVTGGAGGGAGTSPGQTAGDGGAGAYGCGGGGGGAGLGASGRGGRGGDGLIIIVAG